MSASGTKRTNSIVAAMSATGPKRKPGGYPLVRTSCGWRERAAVFLPFIFCVGCLTCHEDVNRRGKSQAAARPLVWRKLMNRTSQLLFVAAAFMLMVGAAGGNVYAQSASGRALFSYPMRGQTSEQQEADRAACHEWAVAQTGHDPSLVFAAQRAGVPTRTIANVTRRTGTTAVGPLGGARGTSEVQRLNERYDAYLRAGQVCLEARGYQVSR
jgi:hypothetical protein